MEVLNQPCQMKGSCHGYCNTESGRNQDLRDSTEIGNYNRAIKAHNSKLSRLRKLISDIASWLKRFREAIKEVSKENKQPTLLDYHLEYLSMKRAGRRGWSNAAKNKVTVKDMQMTARLSDWMTRNQIFRLADLERAVATYQADFDLISEQRYTVKKIETGLKYIDTVIRLKSVVEKSKKEFKIIRERYAEEHADEIAEYNKAVRYLKANQMIPDDRRKYEGRRETLLQEIAQIEEKLRTADLDPEIIRTLRYQIDKVMEAGGIPEKKESVLGKLERFKAEAEEQKRQGTEKKQILE